MRSDDVDSNLTTTMPHHTRSLILTVSASHDSFTR